MCNVSKIKGEQMNRLTCIITTLAMVFFFSGITGMVFAGEKEELTLKVQLTVTQIQLITTQQQKMAMEYKLMGDQLEVYRSQLKTDQAKLKVILDKGKPKAKKLKKTSNNDSNNP